MGTRILKPVRAFAITISVLGALPVQSGPQPDMELPAAFSNLWVGMIWIASMTTIGISSFVLYMWGEENWLDAYFVRAEDQDPLDDQS